MGVTRVGEGVFESVLAMKASNIVLWYMYMYLNHKAAAFFMHNRADYENQKCPSKNIVHGWWTELRHFHMRGGAFVT